MCHSKKVINAEIQRAERRNNKKIKKSKTEKHNCTNDVTEVDLNQHKLSFKDVVLYLKEKPEIRTIFTEVTKLVKLLLTVPSTSCTNERSFSTLRRLKSYLRSTMLSERLNNFIWLHVYRAILDTLGIKKMLNDFILRNEIHKEQFAMEY